MFNIFSSNVFIEIGQAIGNVGEKLFGHGKAEMVESILKRRLQEANTLSLPGLNEPVSRPQEEAIEASYRIISEEGR